MKAFVLLVTWFVPGMAPESYQATFNSAGACQVARRAVHAEAQRMAASVYQRADAATAGTQQGSLLALSYAPAVTAVCVPQ